GYDRDSLRETIVEACRPHLVLRDEAEYRAWAPAFAPTARRRVQDDLTAPHIHWYGLDELVERLASHGFAAMRRDPDFGAFLRGRRDGLDPRERVDEEFQPHQLLCRVADDRTLPRSGLTEPGRPHAADVALIGAMAEAAFAGATDASSRERLAVGLLNTHFTAVGLRCGGSGRNPVDTDLEPVLREDFIFLTHALIDGDASRRSPEVAAIVELARRSASDAPRADLGDPDRFLDRYLREQVIRI
ncbi:MAG: hypothetical protein KDC38_08255, partial [Planctomycetes bacterium]|nr:hypothetical protein [Planctomycetota bacterium]